MKIFFSGIGGSGVSAIAGFMKDKGHVIVGSDRLFDKNPDHPLKKNLEANSISIVPQDGGIDGSYDFAVFSTAVEKSNPDFQKAVELGIPVKTRPEYLAELITEYRAIAVAGTSGKSTTSGMLAFLMNRLGMSPNFIGGGRVKQLRSEKNQGNYIAGESDLLVIEACESDGTIINYRPAHSIFLNLDFDHHSIEETAGMFSKLADNTSDMIFLNADDRNLEACRINNAKTFSIDNRSAFQAQDVIYQPLKTEFKISGHPFLLNIPGKHNLSNAVACIAFLSETGNSLKRVASALPDFRGIERRFDIHFNSGNKLVIDDYAHNPHKISNMMRSIRNISDRVCYIFQPHGFGPTRLMKEGYIETFINNLRESDQLILLPIYYAGGTAANDISNEDIALPVRNAARNAVAVRGRDDVFGLLNNHEVYVVFGARDDSLSDLAEEIAGRLQ